MARNSLQFSFANMAEGILPPWLTLKEFAPNTKLHPFINPIKVDKEGNQTGGGFDNSKTIFGLIQPAAHGKSLILQVAEDTEKAIEENSAKALDLLLRDVRRAAEMWDTHSQPHEIANNNTVKL